MKPATEPSPSTDGRDARWSDHRANRRQQILIAAAAAVCESGPDVGIQEIADRAVVPRSLIYRLFGDRAGLDTQLRQHVIDDVMARVVPTLSPEGTFLEAISRTIDAYVSWCSANRALHRLVSPRAPSGPGGDHAVVDAKTEVGLRISKVVDVVLAAGSPSSWASQSLAFAMVGMVDVTVDRWLDGPPDSVDAEQLSAQLQRWVWLLLRDTAATHGIVLAPETQVAELFR